MVPGWGTYKRQMTNVSLLLPLFLSKITVSLGKDFFKKANFIGHAVQNLASFSFCLKYLGDRSLTIQRELPFFVSQPSTVLHCNTALVYQSLTRRYLGYFQSFAITYNAVMNHHSHTPFACMLAHPQCKRPGGYLHAHFW